MPQEMPTARTRGFHGARIVLFERRMAEVMARSVRSHGGEPIVAPSMREISLADHHAALAFGQRLLAGQVDLLICLTGVGTRLLFEALSARHGREVIVKRLHEVTIVARGPKPIRVLNEYHVPITLVIPEPNTWREVIQALDLSDRAVSLEGKTVAIQEYGIEPVELLKALAQRGAQILRVPVYQWTLPEDLQPLREAIRQIIAGSAHGAVFTNAAQVRHVLQVAAQDGVESEFRQAMRRIVVASVGPTTSEALVEEGIGVDFEPSHPKMGPLITEFADQLDRLRQEKVSRAPLALTTRVPSTAPDPSGRAQSIFLKACRREPVPVTPVWFMRQAGRYLSAYRALRNKVPFLELCKRKDLVAQVTVMAVETLKVDAAILFSDILLIVEPFGFGLAYEAGDGPTISGSVTDVDRLPEVEPSESLRYVFDAVRLTRSALAARVPLIGFSAAPFTLASYLIEGGSSSSFIETKRFMYDDPCRWHALMEKLTRGLIKYVNGQIAAGVDAIQLFDTWVGCLAPHDYHTLILPHTRALIRSLTPGVPVIHFGTGTAALLPRLREAGGDVIGVDFRVELDAAWHTLGDGVGIQGNLDPVVLCSELPTIRASVQRVLEHAANRPGHIFNLGHGILPMTPEDHAIACVEMVHELSRR